jgi:hypothetical protein
MVPMRQQQGGTGQYGGTGENLTWPLQPALGHQEAGPQTAPSLPSLVAACFYGTNPMTAGARTGVMSGPAQSRLYSRASVDLLLTI